MKFSIIIPVRSINNYLKENIKHLKELDYEDFEVIILIDTDEHYDFADQRFKVIHIAGNKGPGEKRNIGAAEATGAILAFLDDDAYPTKNWLTVSAAIFKQEPYIYALGAPAVTPPNASLKEKIGGMVLASRLTGGGTVYRHVPLKPIKIKDYPTVNLFVKKAAFDAVDGFSTEFWPGEDTKLCLDLVKSFGEDFIYDPRPIVYHHRREIFRPHLKQVSRYGTHRGQFARIYPETSRIPSYFVPSLFVLGLILGPIAALFYPFLWDFYISVLLVYIVLVFLESAKISIKEPKPLVFFYAAVGIVLTHLVYGVSFINGFVRRPVLKLREIDSKTGR